MSNPSSNQPRGPEPRDNAGAYRIAEDRRKRPWWLLALLGLLLLALLLFLLSRCGADDPVAGTAPTTSASAAAPSTPAASSPATASAPAASATPGSTTSPGTGGAGSAAPSGAATESPAGTASAGTGAGAPSGAGTSTGTAGAGAGAGLTGTLTAEGTSLLPLSSAAGAGGDLSQYAGQDVTARGVRVQSVPADEGFWVGTSEQDRVWVQLTGNAGESAYRVKEGDVVDFTGTMRATSRGFADRVGVDSDEGADQLQAQRQHIEVAKNAVRLSR